MPTPTSASQPRATHGVKVWLSGFVTALLLTGIAPAQAESPAGLPAGLPAGVSGADVATEGTAAAALPLPPVTVTVSIESITVLGGIDLSLTDSVVSIDWEEFTGAPVGDPVLDDTIRPGWTFTKEVDPARAVFNDLIPIRIEMNGVSPQFPFGRTLLDADPFACPGFPLGCAFEDINRPPSDDRGLDLWVDLVTGATLGNKATPGGSGSSCVSGTQTLAARVCFTVTRSHFTVPTTVPDDPDDPFNSNDPADPYDHVCHLHDCSLRQAVRDAGTPGTELRLPAGHYVLNRQLLFETPGVTMTGLPGGVVIEQTAPDERVVEVDGPGDLEGVDPITIQGVTLIGGNSKVSGLRGHFHGGGVHNHGKLELQNVTITGNFAPGNGDGTSGRGGGGIYNAGIATLINVTIAGNTAENGGAGLSGSPTSTTSLHNTLIAHNTGGDGNCLIDRADPIQPPRLDNLGGNLEFPGDTCGPALADAARDPAPAASGPARTWPPARGGPAVDGGVFAASTADFCLAAFDQLAVNRPQQGTRGAPARCDIGAIELRLPQNTPPQVSVDAPAGGYRTVEGAPGRLTATASDPTGDPLTFTWKPATLFEDPTSPTPNFVAADEGTYTVQVLVSDGELTATATATVTVDNVAPTLTPLTISPSPFVLVRTQVTATTTVTDPGVNDVQTCTFTWDDPGAPASTVVTGTGTGTTRSCTATHGFATAGVYRVSVTANDGDGGQASTSTLVVVFDPNAGRVTGGGQSDSPPGAVMQSPASSSMSAWSFSVRYPRDAMTPIGRVEWKLRDGTISFTSVALTWMVVAGPRFQVAGTGDVNGRAGHQFLLTGVDGRQPGGGGVDRLRLKITSPTGAVVYDNVLDPAATDDIDDARPAPVRHGNVVVH